MATKVTEKEKKKMWEMYQKMGCYKKVAKKMRRNPATVSRYAQEYETAVRAASYIMSAQAEQDTAQE